MDEKTQGQMQLIARNSGATENIEKCIERLHDALYFIKSHGGTGDSVAEVIIRLEAVIASISK